MGEYVELLQLLYDQITESLRHARDTEVAVRPGRSESDAASASLGFCDTTSSEGSVWSAPLAEGGHRVKGLPTHTCGKAVGAVSAQHSAHSRYFCACVCVFAVAGNECHCACVFAGPAWRASVSQRGKLRGGVF